jgi:hypothetical protein
MNTKCPNCNQFKFSKSIDGKGCGLILIFIFPLILLFVVPGGAKYHGGNFSFDDIFRAAVFSIGAGILILLYSFIFPQKTVTFTCSNCNFTQKQNKN